MTEWLVVVAVGVVGMGLFAFIFWAIRNSQPRFTARAKYADEEVMSFGGAASDAEIGGGDEETVDLPPGLVVGRYQLERKIDGREDTLDLPPEELRDGEEIPVMLEDALLPNTLPDPPAEIRVPEERKMPGPDEDTWV